jgi:hypothetical protein
MFARVLGDPDTPRDISRFMWRERGWGGGVDQFRLHLLSSLDHNGHGIFARKMSYHDAYVVYKRLERAGFLSAMILTPPSSSDPLSAPSPRARVCDGCLDAFEPSELQTVRSLTAMRCETCALNHCATCAAFHFKIAFPILFGKDAGLSLLYPSPNGTDSVMLGELPCP